ncbi:hypothetical protein PTSG_11671 [Salpingoeca rosetta]|uniref:Uncharacterized protein n=1 Tax=Salpingoeca rosetta (strain ATCC 50818 / BSB-021) TaxID=946362 RepID=F2TY50_SALR5|nr:uncharacterized protein PTSG_11671 [Salpingoeca rosetta]EGD76309.1 hypothetical protein PTSG_11671 [Salpingoeca rosetta]|eukprot:XP_004998484.1 hypothetical protein PTSG_11671 [Salpingoeca rosetta]
MATSRLFAPKTRVVDWGSIKAIDVDDVIATENEDSLAHLEELYDMIVRCAPAPSALKKDILQLFRVTQLLLELKADDAEEYAQQLQASQRSAREAAGPISRPSTGGDSRQLQRKVEQLQLELRHKTESLELAQQDVQNLSSDLEAARSHADDLEAANKNLIAEIDDLKAHAEAKTAATAEAAQHQDRISQQLQEQRAAMARMDEALREAQEQVQRQREQLAQAQAAAAEDEKRAEGAESRVHDLAARVSSLERELETAVRDRDAALAHADILASHVADNTAADTRILAQVDATVKKWQHMLGEKDAELAAAREVMSRLQDEVVRQRQEAGREVEEMRRQHEGEVAALEQQLAAVQREGATQGTTPSLPSTTARDHETQLKNLRRTLEEAQAQNTRLRARMRQYEEGFGLSDALQEVEDLEAKVRQQDSEIEQRTQEANAALRRMDRLLDENAVLRERAGIFTVGSSEIDQMHADRRQELEGLRDAKTRLQADLDAARDETARLRQKLRKYATLGRVVGADEMEGDETAAENDIEVSLLQRKLQAAHDELAEARADATEFRRRWTHAQDALTAAEKREREKEREAERLGTEVRMLKAALYQLAQEMNNLQFYINKDGDLREYKVSCPSVRDLLAFYNSTAASASPSHTTPAQQQDTSAAPTASSPSSSAAQQRGAAGASADLITLYQSDILALRTAKAELARAFQELQREHRRAVADLERARGDNKQLTKRAEDLERVNAELQSQQWLQLPVQLPATGRDVVHVLNQQLLETLHELDKKQEHIVSMNRQLLQLEQQYAVLVKQKDLLYQEHNEKRKEWEEEKSVLESRVEEAEHAKTEAAQWRQQLNDAMDTIAAVKRGEERALLASLARKVSRLRVNNAALERRYKLSLSREEAATRQLRSLRAALRQCESAARITIDAAKQKNDETTRELYECMAQLEECVPRQQVDSLHRRCEVLAARYQKLLSQHHDVQQQLSTCRDASVKLVQAENSIALYQREVEMLQARCNNANTQQSTTPATAQQSSSLQHEVDRLRINNEQEHQRAEVLALKVKQTEDLLASTEERCQQLDGKLQEVINDNLSLKEKEAELLQTIASRMHLDEATKLREELKQLKEYKHKTEAEITVLKRTADIAVTQADTARRLAQTKDEELHALRTQLIELQVEDDERLQIGRLSHQLLAAQMAEADAVRRLDAEKRKSLAQEREIKQLQVDVEQKHTALIEQSQVSRQRLSHLNASLSALRTQYAGAVTLHQQEQAVQALQDVLETKRRLEDEVAEAKRQREEAQSHVDALRIQQQHLQETMAALGDTKAMTLQANEWQQRLTRARLQTLQLQRRVHDLEGEVDHLSRAAETSRHRQAQLEAEAVEMTQSFEQRETAWLKREEQLEKWLSELDHRMRQQTVQVEARRRDDENFLPASEWPIGQQLSHAIESIKRLLQQRSDLRDETKRLEHRVQDQIVELAEANAATRRAEAAAKTTPHTGANQHDADDDDNGDGGGDALEDASLRYQLDRVIKVSQQTIASLQNMLDTREKALDEAHAQLDEQHQRHEAEKREWEETKKELEHRLQLQNANTAAPPRRPTAMTARGGDAMQVVDEMRAHVRRLETDNELLRQDARRAQERLATKEKDLLAIKRELVGSLQELEAEFRGVVEERDALEEQLNATKAKLQEAEDGLRAQQREAMSLRQSHEEEAAVMRSALERSQKYIDALSQPGSPKVTMETLRKRLARKTAEVKRLQYVLVEVKKPGGDEAALTDALKVPFMEKARALEQERDELKEELATLKSRAAKAEANASTFKTQAEDLQSQLETHRKESSGAVALSAKFERDLKRTKGELEASRKRCQALEQQLKSVREQARETRAQTVAKAPTSARDDSRKPHVSRDLQEPSSVKWEADKKLQKRMENLKSKLATKEEELQAANSQVANLKATIERLKRERNALQRKTKALEAASEDHATLRARVERLQEEKTQLRRELEVDANVRVMELQAIVRDLEAKLADKTSTSGKHDDLATDGKKGTLEKQVLDLKAENLQLQLQLEQAQATDVSALKAELASLREQQQQQQQSGGGAGGGGGKGGRTAVEASELQRVRKLNRQLRTEREKANERAHEADKTRERLQQELNDCHRNQEMLEAEIQQKQQRIDKLQASLERMAANEERLQSRAALPAQAETRLEELEEENRELRAELSAFDPEFFEEIETLKYEHQQAKQEVARLRALLSQQQQQQQQQQQLQSSTRQQGVVDVDADDDDIDGDDGDGAQKDKGEEET